jgi:hypothetical protein
MFDACTDGDAVAVEIARRWTSDFVPGRRLPGIASGTSWSEISTMDKRIFLGEGRKGLDNAVARL